MVIILFDPAGRENFYPFSATRALSHLRMGIFTMLERWERSAGVPVYTVTSSQIQPLYPQFPLGEAVWVSATVFPSANLVARLSQLHAGHALVNEQGLVAAKGVFTEIPDMGSLTKETITDIRQLEFSWQLMQWNDEVLRSDFALLTAGRTSSAISNTNQCIEPENIFLEEGVSMEHCIINAATGPVYIGKNATIMEGTAIRGPFAMGEGSVLKLNSRIYGATTLGPYCMGGGEIKNSILMGFSNKAHDGYMGDSVIGEWCNWGAGTCNSNLKNSGGNIKLWNEAIQGYMEVGNKCGVMMGDYSRTAIQSAINTGTVIGVSCNVFGSGLLPNHITDFCWGTTGQIYRLDTALAHIANWKAMKGQELDGTEQQVLSLLHAKVSAGG